MGIYDRDYERERPSDYDSPGFHIGGGSISWTNRLLIVMGVIYVVQLLTLPGMGGGRNAGWFTNTFSLSADLPQHFWRAYELLTYGFLHDPGDIRHIVFNCFALWMFGRIVEQRIGGREYLAFFLVSVVAAGLFWLACEIIFAGAPAHQMLLGASGGITAVLVLFCLYFPHQTVYLGFLFPIRAWVFALIFIGQDLLFAMRNNPEDNVAYTAHIGGAIFALAYFFSDVRLARFLPGGFKLPKLTGPSLRVHTPNDGDEEDEASEGAVDDILRKIREHGQDSLTRQERRILEQASKEYQKRRR